MALYYNVLLIFFCCLAAEAAVPLGFSDTTVASGLTSPTSHAHAPDGRIFVSEQGGKLRVVKNGALLATPFVTLTVSSTGERGLLGVAFDPNFGTNNYVYVYYTATSPSIHNRISRFTASGDIAVAGSEFVVIDLPTLSSATNHNGGSIRFGPDGKLYVGVGDNANGANAQSFNTLLGKFLRLNADGTIPSDNPFLASTSNQNQAIWAVGLRNPFTFAFHPTSGRLFINDVGLNTFEEIDEGISGANYGWPNTEGPTTTAGQTTPLYYYAHGTGPTIGCAITGGTFYAPATAKFPANFVGKYFFADYCGNWINAVDPANSFAVSTFATGISAPVDLSVSSDGALYYLARGTSANQGVLGKISYTASGAPTVTSQPASVAVSVGASAVFSVVASGALPMTYQWQRGTTDISGATGPSYTLAAAALADSGATFRCVLTNGDGTATSAAATLTVVTNTPPTATITSPTATTYRAGSTIAYSATATDAQETLTASRFTWEVIFHHDTHTHPFLSGLTGTSGSFTIPTTGETATNVYYEIKLTVTDSGGLSTTVSRNVNPQVVTLTLKTSPATTPTALALAVDDVPCTAPCTFSSVVGMTRKITATSPQTVNARTYKFQKWSDNKAAAHTITAPTTATTYTASYQ